MLLIIRAVNSRALIEIVKLLFSLSLLFKQHGECSSSFSLVNISLTDTRFFSSNLPEISLTVCQFRDISDDASVASMPGRTTRFRQGKIYLSSSSFPSDSLFLSLLSAFSRRKHLNLKTHLSSLFCTLRNAGYF